MVVVFLAVLRNVFLALVSSMRLVRTTSLSTFGPVLKIGRRFDPTSVAFPLLSTMCETTQPKIIKRTAHRRAIQEP